MKNIYKSLAVFSLAVRMISGNKNEIFSSVSLYIKTGPMCSQHTRYIGLNNIKVID